jgi:molybdenum cofactor biosynthesis enzyme MoaA
MVIIKSSKTEYPRLVAIETTNYCNAKCEFCPNNVLVRDRRHMSDALFEQIIEGCREFPLKTIEPFLNGEPLVDPKLMPRLELIKRRLPETKIRLFTNGHALTPCRIKALCEFGLESLIVSVNTLDPQRYKKIMGLEIDRLLANLRCLTDPIWKNRVARQITFRMTRLPDTSKQEQHDFKDFCKRLKVNGNIKTVFNYKGDKLTVLPVPPYPCEHITRVDVLSNGVATLCCMDPEGKYPLGDAHQSTILSIFNSESSKRYRCYHRSGRRVEIEPCNRCNLPNPSLLHMPLFHTLKAALQVGCYYLRNHPKGMRP